MRPKSLILLALALGCGLAASIGISQMMDARNGAPQVQLDTTPIYIALHNINLNDPISASMVALEEWPSDKVPKGAIASLEDLEGRRPRATVFAGTPIVEAQLLAQGEVADPVGSIPDGFRLSTISVNAEKSAAGLLSPGDRVDVQLYMAANSRNNVPEAITKVILQNIRVFAVEQAVQRAAEEGDEAKTIPKTVSLLVTPEQASKIDLAQNVGELSLIPRNPNDEVASQSVEVTLSDILESRSQRNTREEEQDRKAETPKSSLVGTFFGMMKRAANERRPFEMTIVQAEEVATMRFDPRTGAPLLGEQEQYQQQASRRRTGASTASYTDDGRLDFTGAGSSDAGSDAIDTSDFPIDFGGE